MFRVNEKAFSRKRILDFPKLVIALLSNLSKTLSIEVFDMIQTFQLVNYSKQAFSWARLNLKYTAFIYLNNQVVQNFYLEDYKTFKGRILLAVDGFTMSLPNVKKLGKKFGYAKNQKSDSINPIASCIAVYDILNELILSSSMRRYSTEERKMAESSIDKILKLIPLKKFLLVADRGFPSLGMLFYLASKNIDFVIRNSSPFIKEFNDIYDGKENDLVKNVAIDKERYRDNKDYQNIFDNLNRNLKLRMVKVSIGENKFEYLITNLLNTEEFSREDLKEIYRKRWCIETDIKRKKVLAELENFASKTSFRIKQEFYAKILIMNFSNIMIGEVEEELQKKKNDTSYIPFYRIKKTFDSIKVCPN